MADGGELAAAFRALAEDGAQAGENIGDSMGKWFEDTADIEEENVNRTLAADAENTRALTAIKPNPGNLIEGGEGDVSGGTEGGTSRIAQLINGDDGVAGDDPLADDPGASNTPEGQRFKTNSAIDRTLNRVNPKFKSGESAYSENCTGVVQANELTRRGVPSEAGPLEKPLRTDEGGPGGRPLSVIEKPWGVKFTAGSKADIENAFKDPGSRGVVYIKWNRAGAHVFNVENVDGQVRFVDAQPNPPVTDASSYFGRGHSTSYVRLDDRPTPSAGDTKPYLEPGP
jgi:papain fold toxin 1 (glutamine deamidase) of polymorphic toxin system